MRRSSKNNKGGNFSGAWICLLLGLLVVTIIGGCQFYRMHQKYSELRQDISLMNFHAEPENQNEYTQTIDFLENEMTKFREYTENQQDFLLWLLGAFGVTATALMAYLGVQNRKDISGIIRDSYQSIIQKEMADLIGGREKIQYLESGIQKEEYAKNRKILFIIRGDDENRTGTLNQVYRMLEMQQYKVDKYFISSGKIIEKKQMKKWVKNYEILVYQPADEEDGSAAAGKPGKPAYQTLSSYCKENHRFCLFYCENFKINLGSSQPNFYASTVNYGLTLLERLYTLLYFVREEDTDEV